MLGFHLHTGSIADSPQQPQPCRFLQLILETLPLGSGVYQREGVRSVRSSLGQKGGDEGVGSGSMFCREEPGGWGAGALAKGRSGGWSPSVLPHIFFLMFFLMLLCIFRNGVILTLFTFNLREMCFLNYVSDRFIIDSFEY